MFKITDISLLGTDYTITDSEGKILQTIQIVTADDILDAALGEYNDDFSNISEYLEKSHECLSGFKNIDPYSILCWTTTENNFDLVEIIEHAIKHSYTKIIVECIPSV